jgi:hypothetical protein
MNCRSNDCQSYDCRSFKRDPRIFDNSLIIEEAKHQFRDMTHKTVVFISVKNIRICEKKFN